MSKNNSMQLQLPILVDVVSDSAQPRGAECRSQSREVPGTVTTAISGAGDDSSVYSAMASRYFEQLAKIK